MSEEDNAKRKVIDIGEVRRRQKSEAKKKTSAKSQTTFWTIVQVSILMGLTFLYIRTCNH